MQNASRWGAGFGAGLLVAMLVAGSPVPVAAADDPWAVQAEIRRQAERLGATGGIYVQGLAIATGGLLPEFYAGRDYRPAWTSEARIDELLALLATAEAHGLDPADYNLPQLQALRARRNGDPAVSAALDLLLTESLIRFGYHQRFGKVNPARLEPTWNFTRQFRPGQAPLTTLRAAVDAPSLQEFLGAWISRAPLYRALQEQLAIYRGIAAAGGWPPVPEGPTLRPGDRDARVPVLRQRLEITGDLAAGSPPAEPDLYDAGVAGGVREFQERHALDADGILGARTVAAMNVPVYVRIDQLRMSLERARWVLDDTAGEVVVVNVAGYEVLLARDGKPFWWRRAVVGREARKTPIFKGSMTYIDINPTWTVPPTILRQDLLPKLRRNPGYLAANNMVVLDRNGRRVDPASINWQATASGFPYVIRQEPGPTNALGRIKFMFPNTHAVFLHDTPSRELFGKSERLFSSGCIRVEDPLSLAEILLADPAMWNQQTLEAAIATGKTRTVRLPRPWPVLILYWTAELDGEGRVRFLRDVYGRDSSLLAALNGQVVIEFPREPVS
jgi:murein L,D-transpeptidase YcbB/YkuD